MIEAVAGLNNSRQFNRSSFTHYSRSSCNCFSYCIFDQSLRYRLNYSCRPDDILFETCDFYTTAQTRKRSIENYFVQRHLKVHPSRPQSPTAINPTSIRCPDLPPHPFRRSETIQPRDLTRHILVLPLLHLGHTGLFVVCDMGNVDERS